MTVPLALIIEDDQDLANIFAKALEAAGYKIEIARDGNVALEQLSILEPAVVVLDLHLPYVSGRTILRRIRTDRRLDQTRVMLATADPLLAESLRGEADLVLLKPISYGQLRDLATRLRPPGVTGAEDRA